MKSTTRSPRMERSRLKRHGRFIPLATTIAAVLAGCGSSAGDSSSPPPDYAKALKGAPAPLAAIYNQTAYGSEQTLSPGGVDGFDAELAKLKGYPVVVNVWASWCLPCRAEFPWFQKATAKFGKHVAFLGVDANDESGPAEDFLANHQVPYPSFEASDTDAKSHFNLLGYPATIIYDSKGEIANKNVGGYASQADLFADIQQYAQ